MKEKVALIGAGYMGKEYCKVLKALNMDFVVFGNREENIRQLREQFGCVAFEGGLENNLECIDASVTHAIVAVPVIRLSEITKLLIKQGIRNILVEKPAGKNAKEINELCGLAEECGISLYVAYNRRFYSSVDKTLEMIRSNNEKIVAVDFEFTEWLDRVYKAHGHDKEIMNIFLSNSTHVVDLAFFFAGLPVQIACYNAGFIDWSHNKSQYAGAGVTDRGVLFSYHANWGSPGRWRVEVITDKNRYIFAPMEELKIQHQNSVNVEDVALQGNVDCLYKPGVYSMVQAFAGDGKRKERLLDISVFNRTVSSVYTKMES